MRTSDEEKVVAIAKVKSEKDEEKIISDDQREELESKGEVGNQSSEKEDFENKYMSTFENEDEEQMQYESEQGSDDSEEN